jgi:hypothetical protein
MLCAAKAAGRLCLTTCCCQGRAMASTLSPTQLLCSPGMALRPFCLAGFSLLQLRPPVVGGQPEHACQLAVSGCGIVGVCGSSELAGVVWSVLVSL